jgi:hypothetical protein
MEEVSQYSKEYQAKREAKLPRWAQMELSNLRSQLEQTRALQAQTAPSPDWVEVDPYNVRQGLPQGARVRFHLGGPDAGFKLRQDVDARLSYHQDGGQVLEVAGDGPLQLEMVASNVIHVRVRNRA